MDETLALLLEESDLRRMSAIDVHREVPGDAFTLGSPRGSLPWGNEFGP